MRPFISMTYGNYPDLTVVKKVLVIKMRHLGDVLLSTPLFQALKRAIPDAEIDAYVYTESVPMLEGHAAISKILTYDRSWKKLGFFTKLRKEIQILRAIRREKYDLVINLTEGDRGAIAAKVAQAKYRVGFDPEGKGIKGKKKLYTHVVKKCSSLRHMVERDLDVARRIGIFSKEDERELFFQIPLDATMRMQEVLQKNHFENYILIHPASRWKFKCWSVEKMRECVEKLLEREKKLVFTAASDPHEMQMVEEIVKDFPSDRILNLSGQVSLKELGALMKLSDAMLCVDSVPLHIASALKVPTVVLFGPTSDITWGPWQNPHARIVARRMSCRPCYLDGCGGSKMSDCLHSLPVGPVLAALESLTVGIPAQNNFV